MTDRQWTRGAYWAIPLPDGGGWGFVRLLEFPNAAFLKLRREDKAAAAGELDAAPTLFNVAVHENALGRWSPLGITTDAHIGEQPPPRFIQDPLQPSNCTISDADGRERSVSPEECAGLERSAVWSPEQARQRLWDELNGRENTHAVLLRAKA